MSIEASNSWKAALYHLLIIIVFIANCYTTSLIIISADIHESGLQSIDCPNYTPLQYITYNTTSTGHTASIVITCTDSHDNITYIPCTYSHSFPTLLQYDHSSTHQLNTACMHNCYISGVSIVNGSIAWFACSTFNAPIHITTCSWSAYNSIGDTDLIVNNSFIHEAQGLVSYTTINTRTIHWQYKYCSYLRIGSSLLCELTTSLHIEQFHAIQQPNNKWELHCDAGYRLIGISSHLNCTSPTHKLYTVRNYCHDCCAPLDIPLVLTTCNTDNFTKLHCNQGYYLKGSTNDDDTYCSSLLSTEVLPLFYCEGLLGCESAIKHCTDCVKHSGNGVLCKSCTHPDGYRTKLTKNQKKCKVIATITNLYTTRTVETWKLTCQSAGSPRVHTALYVDGKLKSTSLDKIIQFVEPIEFYGVKTVECVAQNTWGNDSNTLVLSLQPIIMDSIRTMYLAHEDSSITMDCVTHGDYTSWNWYYEDELIQYNTNHYYTHYPNTSLRISNITSNVVQGEYKCIATAPLNVMKTIVKTIHYIEPVIEAPNVSVTLSFTNSSTQSSFPDKSRSITITTDTTPIISDTISPSVILLIHMGVVYFIFVTCSICFCIMKLITKH